MKTYTTKSKLVKTVLIAFLLFNNITAKAQYVTIPDPNFVNFLTINFPGCMSGNQMDTTCTNITSATTLDLNFLSLTNVDGIQYFDNLLILNCHHNSLTGLPNLPPSLTSLDCMFNNLTSLPALPASLTFLNCFNNSLTSLPSLPPNLDYLNVILNNLTSLPPLPNSITTLHIGNNNASTMPLTLPPTLSQFSCKSMGLTSLPLLPSTLQNLECDYNIISSLPPLPNALIALNCNSNLLTSLPSLPNGLQVLFCNNNPLACLPALPMSIDNVNFEYTNVTCMPNYPNPTNYVPNFYSLPLCDLASGCPSGYSIMGKLYSDNNSDCGYQLGENLINMVGVKLYQSGILMAQSYNFSGYYSFTTGLGNYDVVVDTTNLPFTYSCTNPGLDTNINLTALDSVAEDVDFGFVCKPGYDVGINSIYRSSGMFFPGQNVQVHACIGDLTMLYNGSACNSAGVSGTVQITYTGPASYISPASGALAPAVSGNILTYTIADFSLLNPNTDFGLLFSTDTNAVLGNQVCFAVSVTSSGTEISLVNNLLNHCFPIINSYDPNMKEVSPVGDLSYPFNDWLTYTVHFQNTGNAPAINIKVLDALDSDLDASTFRLVNSSHDVNVNLNGSNAAFLFNGIMLEDSTSNEPASHGFIQYKIKPLSNLSVGTVLNNTANIYFDFNAPITTNTTVNTITTTSGIENSTLLKVLVYPNPASDFLMIQTEILSGNAYVQIIDILGRIIQQTTLTEMNHRVSLEGFANGIYSVKLVDGTQEIVKKIIVSH